MQDGIGLLATGDELITGDVLNTNGQKIAQQLHAHQLAVGQQVTVGDNEDAIVTSLQFLLQTHQSVIIIGGLGPTTDDRTRFAVSRVIEQPLVFFESSWEHIVTRMQRYDLTIKDNNRQQALFPEHARIFPNPNGTASACAIDWHDHHIYMLPGPPRECLPLFTDKVLPDLLKFHAALPWNLHRWRLFSVSESDMGALLEEAVKDFPCQTGYRWDYPYLEFKLQIAKDHDPAVLLAKVRAVIEKYLLCDAYEKASEVLKQRLALFKGIVSIEDAATQGRLQSTLFTPYTQHALRFGKINSGEKADFTITIRGLEECWQQEVKTTTTQLQIEMTSLCGEAQTIHRELPFRHSQRVVDYAVEFIANQLVLFLAKS